MVSFKYILLHWFTRPPGCCLLLIFIGLVVQRKRRKWGTGLIVSGAVLLFLLSLTPVALGLHHSLLVASPKTDEEVSAVAKEVQAIVVLGAGATYSDGEVVLSMGSARRCRRAVHLHHLTNLPILLSSGNSAEGVTDAQLMGEYLEENYQLQAAWLEDKSQNTYEHARNCKPILAENGVERIFLVTDADHVRRAKWCFEKQSIEAVGYPLSGARVNAWSRGLAALTPTARALALSGNSVDEWLANWVYWIRY